jgi:hypothetical protein
MVHGAAEGKNRPQRVEPTGRVTVGEKNNLFLAETLSKLRFFGTS